MEIISQGVDAQSTKCKLKRAYSFGARNSFINFQCIKLGFILGSIGHVIIVLLSMINNYSKVTLASRKQEWDSFFIAVSVASAMSDSVKPPQTAAPQAPPSLGFSRQEHWSGLPFPSPVSLLPKNKSKLKNHSFLLLKFISSCLLLLRRKKTLLITYTLFPCVYSLKCLVYHSLSR